MTDVHKQRGKLIILALFAFAVMLAIPFVGSISISFSDVTSILSPGEKSPGERIFWDIRLPRILLAFIAGATLSACGMSFQALFRNPLATPFTLGVSGGAAFGAVVAINLGIGSSILGLPIPGRQIFAFAGALGSIILVYGIARAKKGFTMATMLLTGIAVSFFFSALIMFMQFFTDFARSFSMVRWMMGSLVVTSFNQVGQLAAFSFIGLAMILISRSELNLLTTGDEIAIGRGVDVEKTRKKLFFAVSLAAGATVAVCGPIGFVGLIIPHIMRLIFGSDHFDLAPACIIGGGVFLVLCDTIARTAISSTELPVGIITALLGGPFFLWLLFRHPN